MTWHFQGFSFQSKAKHPCSGWKLRFFPISLETELEFHKFWFISSNKGHLSHMCLWWTAATIHRTQKSSWSLFCRVFHILKQWGFSQILVISIDFASNISHVQYQLKYTTVNAPQARNLLQTTSVWLPMIATASSFSRLEKTPALPCFLQNYTANQAHRNTIIFLWLLFNFALAKFKFQKNQGIF